MDSSPGKLCINEWQTLKAGVAAKSLQGNHWLRTIMCTKYLINETLKEIHVKMIQWKKTGWFYSRNCPCKAVLLAVIEITGVQAAHPALKDVNFRLQKDILKYCEKKSILLFVYGKLSAEIKQQCWVLGLAPCFYFSTDDFYLLTPPLTIKWGSGHPLPPSPSQFKSGSCGC